MAVKTEVMGYLPNDTPPFGKMLLLGFQHVLTMFPATVLCALLMGFPVSTVLTVTGVGTIVALLGSKFAMGKYIPLYYGSSFSYLAAVMAITKTQFGQVAPAHILSVVQAGFLATGVINVIVGFLIRVAGGKKALDVILPATITGPVACTIGIGLGATALRKPAVINAASAPCWYCCVVDRSLDHPVRRRLVLRLPAEQGLYRYAADPLRRHHRLPGRDPLWPDPCSVVHLPFFVAPTFTFPVFNDPLTLTVIFGVGVMAIATIPESTAHLYQISLYVDHLAEEQGREKYGLSQFIGLNLMLDGLDDIVNGLFGSTAGTNYGENNSLMVITRNYSGPVLLTAGVIAII